ncbi:MAG: hypothetical protein M1819_006955 [Sarea resinae]|nr:MAG: hypothetical protein M1819_006955 [Sarea resinae]
MAAYCSGRIRESCQTLSHEALSGTGLRLLVRANEYLVANHPHEALELYTEFLYRVSPGHPAAFLNRALCYIALGYPELAASDATRAKMVADRMRGEISFSGKSRFTPLLKYLNATTALLGDEGSPWANHPTCYLRGDQHLQRPLASLALAPTHSGTWKRRIKLICTRIDNHASYRLAYALWKCGGGARMDALDTIENACRSDTVMSKQDFIDLGNAILEDIEVLMAREDRDKTALRTPKLDPEITVKLLDDLEMAGIRGEMQTKMTSINPIYPWDERVSCKSVSEVRDQANAELRQVNNNCEIKFVELEDEKLGFALIAKRDIVTGESVLVEDTSLQAATPVEGSVEEQTYWCHTCSAVIVLPEGFQLGASSETLSEEESSSDDSTDGFDEEYDEDSIDPPLFSSQKDRENCPPPESPPQASHMPSSPPFTPPDFPAKPMIPNTPPAPPPHIRIPNLETQEGNQLRHRGRFLFCSQDCYNQAKDEFGMKACDEKIEDSIYSCHIPRTYLSGSSQSANYLHVHAQRLYTLLLAKVFAAARVQGKHPLDVHEVRFLNTSQPNGTTGQPFGLADIGFHDGVQKTRASPWSLNTNIYAPLKVLSLLGLDPVGIDLPIADGWVLNTLLGKLYTSARITRHARALKAFDAVGFEDHRLDDRMPDPREVHCVWVASVHPALSLVGVVNGDEGQANVMLGAEKPVVCIAATSRKATQSLTSISSVVPAIANACASASAEHETMKIDAYTDLEMGLDEIKKGGHIAVNPMVEDTAVPACTAPETAIHAGQPLIRAANDYEANIPFLDEENDSSTHTLVGSPKSGVEDLKNGIETPALGLDTVSVEKPAFGSKVDHSQVLGELPPDEIGVIGDNENGHKRRVIHKENGLQTERERAVAAEWVRPPEVGDDRGHRNDHVQFSATENGSGDRSGYIRPSLPFNRNRNGGPKPHAVSGPSATSPTKPMPMGSTTAGPIFKPQPNMSRELAGENLPFTVKDGGLGSYSEWGDDSMDGGGGVNGDGDGAACVTDEDGDSCMED